MPAQSQVNLYRAEGVPGAKADLSPHVYTPTTPLAEGTGVKVGGFVWPGTDAVNQVKINGTGVPVGFVERDIIYGNYDVNLEGTLELLEGDAVTVAVKGDYWAVATTAATVGQKVYATLADGTLQTAETGQTISGAEETSWVVKTAAAVGDPFIISNWS
jgi:hypothetical protein